MLETMQKAREEMKRADHLIFVSLKYTRTVDVIRNAIERLINAIGYSLEAILIKMKEDKMIKEIPLSPVEKCTAIKEKFGDEESSKMADFFLFLRRLLKEDYGFEREYRRHVAMTVKLDGSPFEVTIDSVTEYYRQVEAFLQHLSGVIKGDSV